MRNGPIEECINQLRKRKQLTLPRRRTEKGKRSLAFRGLMMWNTIISKSKEQGYELFKRGFREDLLNLASGQAHQQVLIMMIN